jgi:hypothetical protein
MAQIRTNIFMPEGSLTEWEQREFRIPSLPFAWPDFGYLYQDTVAQTPDISHNNTSPLTAYALRDTAAILHDKHTIPLTLSTGTPFLAGAALLPGDGGANAKPDFFWDGRGPAPNAVVAQRCTPGAHVHTPGGAVHTLGAHVHTPGGATTHPRWYSDTPPVVQRHPPGGAATHPRWCNDTPRGAATHPPGARAAPGFIES